MEGNTLNALVERLRSAFVGRNELAPYYGGIDYTQQSLTFTVANGATITPLGSGVSGGTFSGVLIVNETTTGSCGVFACGGGEVVLIAETNGPRYTGSLYGGTAGRINLYYGAAIYYDLNVENLSGASKTLYFVPLRIRPGVV